MLSFIASAIRSVFSPRDFGAFQLMVSRLSSYLMLSSASKSFDFAGIIGAITTEESVVYDVLMILRLLAWLPPLSPNIVSPRHDCRCRQLIKNI